MQTISRRQISYSDKLAESDYSNHQKIQNQCTVTEVF